MIYLVLDKLVRDFASAPHYYSDIDFTIPYDCPCVASTAFDDEKSRRPHSAKCGNGLVEEGEACDSGGEEDACCNSQTCQLEPGCVCSNTEACCVNGQFAAQGTICRHSRHSICDTAETCTGTSALCPVDHVKRVETPCTDWAGRSSNCLNGLCVAAAHTQCSHHTDDARYCVSPTKTYSHNHRPDRRVDIIGLILFFFAFSTRPFACDTARCDRIYCSSKPKDGPFSSSSAYSCDIYVSSFVQDGTACGYDSYCMAGACITKEDANAEVVRLKAIELQSGGANWQTGQWSSCAAHKGAAHHQCFQEREVHCVNANGLKNIHTRHCRHSSRPSMRRSCRCPDSAPALSSRRMSLVSFTIIHFMVAVTTAISTTIWFL